MNQSEDAELNPQVDGNDKIKRLTVAIIGEDNAWLPKLCSDRSHTAVINLEAATIRHFRAAAA